MNLFCNIIAFPIAKNVIFDRNNTLLMIDIVLFVHAFYENRFEDQNRCFWRSEAQF